RNQRQHARALVCTARHWHAAHHCRSHGGPLLADPQGRRHLWTALMALERTPDMEGLSPSERAALYKQRAAAAGIGQPPSAAGGQTAAPRPAAASQAAAPAPSVAAPAAQAAGAVG